MYLKYVDIVTGEFWQLKQSSDIGQYDPQWSGEGPGWGNLMRREGYYYISQLRETFYQGKRKYLTYILAVFDNKPKKLPTD